MRYPADMSEFDIMEFEYEYNRILDIEQDIGFEMVNFECAIVADQQQQEVIDGLYDEQDVYLG
jgi:hypothetical protein